MSAEGFFFDFGSGGGDDGSALDNGAVAAAQSLEQRYGAATTPLESFPLLSLADAHTWQQHSERHAQQAEEVLECSAAGGGVLLRVRYQRRVAAELSAEGDIVPGKYYGGLKVWSCAPDLVRFMAGGDVSGGGVSEAARRCAGELRALLASPGALVAEVGCGQGLPGLAALALGARRVVLQDYNKEVLESAVLPNLAANFGAAGEAGGEAPAGATVRLVHGDWATLLPPAAADDDCGGGSGPRLLLGSDVTFDREACERLVLLLLRWLTPGRDVLADAGAAPSPSSSSSPSCPAGSVAYIASKVFYFGTNGGAAELEAAAAAARRTDRALGSLVVREVCKCAEGEDGGMHRVILRVHKVV